MISLIYNKKGGKSGAAKKAIHDYIDAH